MEPALLRKLAEKAITKEQLLKAVESDFGLLPLVIGGVSSSKATIRYGCAKVLVDLSKEGAAYPHQAIISTKTFIRNQPDAAKRFLKGYIDSLALIRRDKEFSMKVLGKYTRTSDRKVLDFTYDAYTESYYVDLKEGLPYPTLKGVQFILDQLAPTNPKAKSAKLEDFVYLEPLKEIGEAGFLKEVMR